jgi:signal peptidase
MTDFTREPMTGSDRPASGTDADGLWWGEPDPVQVFTAGLELALRQLRVEVAGLRAERDGLRLEVEGLRAKLVLAQEQVVSRDGLSDTVRQLQAAVARLTTGEADRLAGRTEPRPMPASTSQPSFVVLPMPEPVTFESILSPEPPAPVAAAPAPVVAPAPPPEPTPTPVPVEPVAPEPIAFEAPVPASADPSAIAQLKAMGLWPKADAAPPVVAAPTPPVERRPPPPPPTPTPPTPTPPSTPPPTRQPEPDADRAFAAEPQSSGSKQTVVNWDQMSTRRTPVVVVDDDGNRVGMPGGGAGEPPEHKSFLRLVFTGMLGVVGALVVLVVLAVSVGPRFLPYQTYFVRSGSMSPTIDTGAMVVLTKTDATTLGSGDIITFNKPDDPNVKVTHRIVGVETTDQGRVFVTKGDANADPDAWRVPASGTGWKYSFNVPYVGYVFGYLGTPQARIALLVIPALVLGLLALLDLWKPKDEQAKVKPPMGKQRKAKKR